MTRFVNLLLFFALTAGISLTGCAGEEGENKDKEDATETSDSDDMSASEDDSEDMDEDSVDADARPGGDSDDDLADAGDMDDTDAPVKKKSDKKAPKNETEDFEDDFEFDDDLDDVFDTSPDPDPNVFVKVDKEPVFKNEEEVRALIKKPYPNAKGKVYAKVLVGLDGRYRSHYIRRSPDKALSNVVAKALESAEFRPAVKDGEPKKVWVDFFYEFK